MCGGEIYLVPTYFMNLPHEFIKTIQNTFGDDSLKKQLSMYLSFYNEFDHSKEPSIFEVQNVSSQAGGYVIYQKGPLVVNKLKTLMGNESWIKFIKEIINNYYDKFLTYDDFIKTLSKYDTKGNIVTKLNQWLSENGYID